MTTFMTTEKLHDCGKVILFKEREQVWRHLDLFFFFCFLSQPLYECVYCFDSDGVVASLGVKFLLCCLL